MREERGLMIKDRLAGSHSFALFYPFFSIVPSL